MPPFPEAQKRCRTDGGHRTSANAQNVRTSKAADSDLTTAPYAPNRCALRVRVCTQVDARAGADPPRACEVRERLQDALHGMQRSCARAERCCSGRRLRWPHLGRKRVHATGCGSSRYQLRGFRAAARSLDGACHCPLCHRRPQAAGRRISSATPFETALGEWRPSVTLFNPTTTAGS